MYALPKEIKEALMQYLSTKPFNEVAQILNILQSLKEIQGQSDQPPKK
jgi:hypothetical protein